MDRLRLIAIAGNVLQVVAIGVAAYHLRAAVRHLHRADKSLAQAADARRETATLRAARQIPARHVQSDPYDEE